MRTAKVNGEGQPASWGEFDTASLAAGRPSLWPISTPGAGRDCNQAEVGYFVCRMLSASTLACVFPSLLALASQSEVSIDQLGANQSSLCADPFTSARASRFAACYRIDSPLIELSLDKHDLINDFCAPTNTALALGSPI